jgi:hypothetical protein
MPARLIALDDDHVLMLDKPIILIGRHEECDIQLESRKVSRRHCCIAQVDDCLAVRDLESTNGVRINGQQVVEGRLHEGDELTIGNLRYRVSWDDAPLEHPSAERERQGRAARGMAVPESVAPDNLISCDIPVPIREGIPAHRASAHPGRPGIHGTERADEKKASNGSSGHHRRSKVSKLRQDDPLREPFVENEGD